MESSTSTSFRDVSRTSIDAAKLEHKQGDVGIMGHGSVWASCITLAKATLGAGVLALPANTVDSGMFALIVLLIVIGYFVVLCNNFMADAAENSQLFSYEDIAFKTLNHHWARLVAFCVLFLCFGGCTAYVVAMGDAAMILTQNWWGWHDRTLFTVLAGIIVLLPMGISPKINFLRYTAMIGLFGVLFLGVAVIYCLGRYGISDDVDGESVGQLFIPQGSVEGVVNACSSIIFAYSNAFNVPQIYEELHVRTPATMAKVNVRATILAFLLYFVTGTLGYLAFGAAQGSDLIIAFQPHSKDVVLVIALIGAVISCMVAHPLHVMPMRQSCEYLFRTDRISFRLQHCLYGTIIVALSVAVALAFPDVQRIVNITGAFAGSILGFVCPSLFAYKLSGEKTIYQKKFIVHLIMIAIGVLVAVVGTILGIKGVVDYY